MATPVQRRLSPQAVRRFGSGREYQLPPDLTEIQTKSYQAFLQADCVKMSRLAQPVIYLAKDLLK